MKNKMINSFAVQTERNFTRCKRIIDQTYDNLSANSSEPEIDAMRAFLEGHKLDYDRAYQDWTLQRKQKQTAATLEFDTLFATYPDRMREWKDELKVYLRSRPDILNQLFPNGRIKLYMTGSQDQRLVYLENFKNILASVTGIPQVTAIATNAANLLSALREKETAKNESQSQSETDASELEATRLTAARALYRLLGRLMDKYAEDPEQIGRFIPFHLLTRQPQRLFSSNRLAAQDTATIMTRTLAADQILRIRNTGSAELQFYRSTQAAGSPGSVSVTVPAGTEAVVTAAALGSGRYYFVRNLSDLVEGSYVFEIEETL